MVYTMSKTQSFEKGLETYFQEYAWIILSQENAWFSQKLAPQGAMIILRHGWTTCGDFLGFPTGEILKHSGAILGLLCCLGVQGRGSSIAR